MLIIIGSNLLKLASIHINIYVIIENYFDHEKKSLKAKQQLPWESLSKIDILFSSGMPPPPRALRFLIFEKQSCHIVVQSSLI